MGQFVRHEMCPGCGSRNNLARYADGSASCFGFGCGHWEPPAGGLKPQDHMEQETTSHDWLQGEYKALEKRGIKKETCEFARYQVSPEEGCHIANVLNEHGKLVAQKLRYPGKEFSIRGNGRDLPFIGEWLWSGGKSIVITEGEVDWLSVLQTFNCKWPVVSLPNGADAAAKVCERRYEFLDRFEKIVLMLDQDEAGQKAAEAAAAACPAGKVFIATLPAKDANDVLRSAGGSEAISKAFWNASPWRPDGIISGAELTREKLKAAVATGFPIKLMPMATEMMYGLRKGELTLLTAGSGIGKSTLAREIGYELHEDHGLRIGNIFLEESNAKTGQAYVAIDNNVPLKNLRRDPNILTDAQWDASLGRVVHNGMWFFNHFGSLGSENLLNRMRYFATVEGVDFILLDHISIVVSGQSSSEGERKDIDIFMTRLRELIEQTGVGVIGIVHLNQPDGAPHEEGGRVTLRHLRGSGSLKQLSDNVVALERDQQGDAPTISRARILKCRETGEAGLADTLNYNRATGRLELDRSSDAPFDL